MHRNGARSRDVGATMVFVCADAEDVGHADGYPRKEKAGFERTTAEDNLLACKDDGDNLYRENERGMVFERVAAIGPEKRGHVDQVSSHTEKKVGQWIYCYPYFEWRDSIPIPGKKSSEDTEKQRQVRDVIMSGEPAESDISSIVFRPSKFVLWLILAYAEVQGATIAEGWAEIASRKI
ncbi:hypothetical protein FB451DRAFT_1380136 [Mycena latifolia]|nr:hypothetical protein FB451DRAFT_1380136 [Mycena latifolia]